MKGDIVMYKRRVKHHRCRKPLMFPWRHYGAGTEWRCECGTLWRLRWGELSGDLYWSSIGHLDAESMRRREVAP